MLQEKVRLNQNESFVDERDFSSDHLKKNSSPPFFTICSRS